MAANKSFDQVDEARFSWLCKHDQSGIESLHPRRGIAVNLFTTVVGSKASKTRRSNRQLHRDGRLLPTDQLTRLLFSASRHDRIFAPRLSQGGTISGTAASCAGWTRRQVDSRDPGLDCGCRHLLQVRMSFRQTPALPAVGVGGRHADQDIVA